MKPSQWNGDDIAALFNKHAAGIGAVYKDLGKDIRGCGIYVDEKTDTPYVNFIFKSGSRPDLSKLPAAITTDGETLPVKHEFRGPAFLA